MQITSLGPALTSEDDRVRTRGVMLFAEVSAVHCGGDRMHCWTNDADQLGPAGTLTFNYCNRVVQVVATAPDLFRLPSDIGTAAEFFSARLADRQAPECVAMNFHLVQMSEMKMVGDCFAAFVICRTCVRGALTGCLALVQRRAAGNATAPALDATAATVVVTRFQQHILVQAFGQVERMLSFDLMLASIQVPCDASVHPGL